MVKFHRGIYRENVRSVNEKRINGMYFFEIVRKMKKMNSKK